MNTRGYILVLCFAVVLSARSAMSIDFFGTDLRTKLDLLKEQLAKVEQTMMTTMESSLKEMEHRLLEKLTNHENNINEKMESKMYSMENSLKKIVEAAKENTRTELEELKNHMIPKLNHIQETSQAELKKLGESMKTLIQIAGSVRNTSNQSNFNTPLHPVSSCRQALNESGKYMMKIEENVEPFEVCCEQNKFEGGWTVIQHRYNGSVDFYRNWTEYRNGFGTLDGEFWLGLEYVHQITKNRPHELLVEMKDTDGNYGYAKYGEFEIGNESEKYVLKKLGTHSGTVGDSMRTHKNHKFSTFDQDNDQHDVNCAKIWHGAWWYNHHCYSSNLNGRYRNITNNGAIVWYSFQNDWRVMSYTRMMIRDIIN